MLFYLCVLWISNAAAELFSYVLVVLFQTVLKSSSLVGGLSVLHTQEVTMIKAEEVSQYGRPQEPLSELYLKRTWNP